MDWRWIYYLCVIFCVNADQYRIYFNPCPHLFKYEREGYEWIGLAQVDSLPLGKPMKLEVILSLPVNLPFVRHPSNPSIQLVSLLLFNDAESFVFSKFSTLLLTPDGTEQ